MCLLGLAPARRLMRRQRDYLLHSLGLDHTALSKGANAGIDCCKKCAHRFEPRIYECRIFPPCGFGNWAGLEVTTGLRGGHQNLAGIPAKAACHDLLHRTPKVGGGFVVILPVTADCKRSYQMP